MSAKKLIFFLELAKKIKLFDLIGSTFRPPVTISCQWCYLCTFTALAEQSLNEKKHKQMQVRLTKANGKCYVLSNDDWTKYNFAGCRQERHDSGGVGVAVVVDVLYLRVDLRRQRRRRQRRQRLRRLDHLEDQESQILQHKPGSSKPLHSRYLERQRLLVLQDHQGN